MALRLRRGTDAERLLITPVQGELIYTTDTKKLYIGDGTAVGGRLVEGAGSPDLAGLDDINVAGAEDGQLLAYNSATLKWEASDLNGVVQGSNYQINITGSDSSTIVNAETLTITANVVNGELFGDSNGTHTGDVLGTLFGESIGIHTGDVNGSVFGDDSTLLVDGVNSQIVGDVNNTQITTTTVNINQDALDGSGINFNNVTAGSNGGNFNFRASRTSLASPTVLEAGDISIDLAASGWDGTTYSPSAVIKLGTDKYTSSIGTGVMPGRIVFLTYNELGATGADNVMVLNRFGNLGIGTDAPAEKLDVRGNIVATGTIQPGVYADSAARDTALTAPTAGQIVFITDVAKFQGNTDGTITGWADLN
jgi:hypothetical protein